MNIMFFNNVRSVPAYPVTVMVCQKQRKAPHQLKNYNKPLFFSCCLQSELLKIMISFELHVYCTCTNNYDYESSELQVIEPNDIGYFKCNMYHNFVLSG